MLRILIGAIGVLAASCASAGALGTDASDGARPGDTGTTRDDVAVLNDAAGSDVTPTAYDNVRALLDSTCATNCHQSEFTQTRNGIPAVVTLRSREVPRLMIVSPGDPSASYLYIKVTGMMNQLPECNVPDSGCGAPMPELLVNGHYVVSLPAEDVELIRAWIASGAPTATSQ